VTRPRPLQRLQQWRDLRIVSVVAPAGYGKTTVVSEWVRSLVSYDAAPQVAWWSLDPSDDSLDVFIQRLLTVLHATAQTSSVIAELIAASSAGQMSARQIGQQLLAALELTASPAILVLDDVHLIGSTEVHDLLQMLMDGAPDGFIFVLLSRTSLPLRLGRHRLSGALLELDSHDLTLDHDEFEAFVRAGSLGRLPADLLSEIEQRGAGWIAGLQMFALAQERGAVQLAADSFVPEFLQHEIVRHLPPDLADILVRSAILPWLDVPSLAGVLDVPRAAAEAALQSIVRTDLPAQSFTASTPSAETAVRLHPLLREYLLNELHRRLPPEEIRRIRERAAAAVAAADDLDAALALLADDDFAAARLLAAHSRHALRRGARVSLRRWLCTISDDALRAQPQLALDAAWLSYITEAGDQRARIAVARDALAASHVPTDVRNEWQTELHLLDGFLAVFDNRFEDALAAQALAAHTPHDPHGLAEAFRLVLCVYLPAPLAPEPSKDRALQQAGEIFRRIGFPLQAIETILARAILLLQSADVPRALLALQEAAAVTDLERLELHTGTAYLYNIRGELMYYLDRLPEARESLQRSLQVGAVIGEMQSTDYWSHLFLQLCDNAEHNALCVDDELDERLWIEGRRRFMPFIVARNAWLRIRRDAATGRIDRIAATLQSLELTLADLQPETHESFWFAILNGSIYTEQDSAQLEAALHSFIDLLHTRDRRWSIVHARTLLALLYARTARITEAREQLGILLPILQRNRCSRFLAEYPALVPIIAMHDSLFAQSMLQLVPANAAAVLLPFGLTDRETEILRMLTTGRETKEISHAMHIAVTTLRAHTNSIYHKLGVHSRTEAVRVARALGMGAEGGE
jgi:LuxR family maltose regulon positive regulatory protein